MAIEFKELTKHGKLQFLPGVAVAFEDADAEPYFVAAGWAVTTTATPVHVYPQGEVDIDHETRDNATGKLVLGDVVQSASTVE